MSMSSRAQLLSDSAVPGDELIDLGVRHWRPARRLTRDCDRVTTDGLGPLVLTSGVADQRLGGETLRVRRDAIGIAQDVGSGCGREEPQHVAMACRELAAGLQNELQTDASVLRRRRRATERLDELPKSGACRSRRRSLIDGHTQ